MHTIGSQLMALCCVEKESNKHHSGNQDQKMVG